MYENAFQAIWVGIELEYEQIGDFILHKKYLNIQNKGTQLLP